MTALAIEPMGGGGGGGINIGDAVGGAPGVGALFVDTAGRAGTLPIHITDLNVMMFGTVKADGVTDDAPALQAIHDAYPGRVLFCPTTVHDPAAGGVRNASYFLGSVPPGNPQNTCLDLRSGSSGIRGDSTGTLMRVAPELGGIRLSGGNNTARNLFLWGSEPYTCANQGRWWEYRIAANRHTPAGWARPCGIEDGFTAGDGLQIASGNAIVENCWAVEFGRCGINASESDLKCVENERPYLANCTLGNNARGVYLQGQDSNVFNLLSLNVNNNSEWGIDNQAYLGGTVVGAQADNNGYCASPYMNVAFHEIVSIARAAGVSSATFNGTYPAAVATFTPGAGVEIADCDDRSFVGRWRVKAVSADAQGNTVVTWDQTGTMDGLAAGDASPPAAVRATGTTNANSTIVDLPSTAGISAGMYAFGPNVPAPTNAYGLPPRVLSVDSATRITLDTSIAGALAGAAPMVFTHCYGNINLLPNYGTIRSAARAGNVVTLTFDGPYAVDGSTGGIPPVPLKPGHGIAVQNSPDPSFNGNHVLTGDGQGTPAVATDGAGNTVLTYVQVGADGATAGGLCRLAISADLMKALGITTGCYRSINGGNITSWIGCYSEGAQRWEFDSSAVAIAPVRSDPIAGLVLTSSLSGLAAPGTNLPLSLVTELDGDVIARRRIGRLTAFSEITCWDDMGKLRADNLDPAGCLWRTKVGPGEFSVYQGDPTRDPSAHLIFYAAHDGETYLGSAPGHAIYLNAFPGLGDTVVIGKGTNDGVSTTTIRGGDLTATGNVVAANIPAPTGNTTEFLRADGTFAVPAGGGGSGGAGGPVGAVQTAGAGGALAGDAGLTYQAGCLAVAATTQGGDNLLRYTGAVAHYPIALLSTLGSGGVAGGLVWYAPDNAPDTPKAGLYLKYGPAGTSVVIGTSASYAVGITTTFECGPAGPVVSRAGVVSAFPVTNYTGEVHANACLTVQNTSDALNSFASLELAPSSGGIGPLVTGRRSSDTGMMLDFYTIGLNNYTYAGTIGETGALVWQQPVRPGKFTTAGRPALTAAQEGYFGYDTDLKRMVVWTGTGWTDFAGNTV